MIISIQVVKMFLLLLTTFCFRTSHNEQELESRFQITKVNGHLQIYTVYKKMYNIAFFTRDTDTSCVDCDALLNTGISLSGDEGYMYFSFTVM